MGIIGKNIRKIRTVKKLSQAAFAEIFNLARPSIGAYEEERSEPKLETVIQIANYFGISIDSLLTKELTINDLYNFNVHMETEIKPKDLEEKAPVVSSSLLKNAMVPESKQLEYIVHINNRDFINQLPKVYLPKYHDRNIRAFEMNADDMHNNLHGLNVGDFVFGKKMSPPYKFDEGQIYIIITKERILIRRVKAYKDHLELSPDNSNFNSIDIETGEIIEAWEVFGYFSTKIEAPMLVSERILHLENIIDSVQTRLNALEKGQST